MQFFNISDFTKAYPEYRNIEETIPSWLVVACSEMIFSQIGLRYRDASWDSTSVPLPIKRAAMEQLRFMLEHDIPFVDFDKRIKAGNMEGNLFTDYSTLALRILSNNGYLYRGNPITSNMNMKIPFGS